MLKPSLQLAGIGLLLLGVIAPAHARAEMCLKIYSSKLTDGEIVDLEKEALRKRMADRGESVVFKNCVEAAKNIQNASAKRARKGVSGMQETIVGIETVSIQSCDAIFPGSEMKMNFKITRFEPLADPAQGGLYVHTGCDEYSSSNLNPVTVEVLRISKTN